MGLAGLLAVVAASSAVGAPATPPQRYLVTIEGTHTFRWQTRDVRAEDFPGCSWVLTGEGSQTTRFRTVAPVSVPLANGRPRRTWGPRLRAEADRVGTREGGFEGTCPPHLASSERRRWDAHRCGHRDFEVPLVDLGTGSSPQTYGFGLYLNAAVFGDGCPSFGARDGFQLEVEAPLAGSKWRAASFELRGSGTKTYDYPSEGSTMTDTWSWTLRARRAT